MMLNEDSIRRAFAQVQANLANGGYDRLLKDGIRLPQRLNVPLDGVRLSVEEASDKSAPLLPGVPDKEDRFEHGIDRESVSDKLPANAA